MTRPALHDALWLALSCTMLLGLAGCPSSGRQPTAEKERPAAAHPAAGERPAAEKPAAGARAPTAAANAPLLLPPSEPLPKLPDEPAVAVPAGRVGAERVLPSSVAAAGPPKVTPGKPRSKLPGGKHSGVPFDPIKENGPIFVGWPKKPKVAIVITGMEEGYIEPCGCAGLDYMKGGMGRRYTFIEGLRNQGWPLVVLDVGGLARGFGRQAEMKFQTLVEAKRKTGYNALAFGASDLQLPEGLLVSAAGVPSLFISANVGLYGLDAGITPKSQLVEAGGLKIGVTAVLGKKYQREINNPNIEFADPEAALKKIVPELKGKADYLVLLAHATRKESEELGRKFPQFNVVVTSDGNDIPPAGPETIPGTKTLLITVGKKGMSAIVLAPFDPVERTCRYQRVPLDSRFKGSAVMKMLMAEYQDQLKEIGFAGLGLRPVPHPLAGQNGRFVGTKTCAESCHEPSYTVWKKSGFTKESGHWHAYETLEKLDPPRNYDPECVSCHVIGWHPTKFFPYVGGYTDPKKTPHLENVGCDDCHGPGEKHCNAELGNNEKLQEEFRKAVRITKEESKKQQCTTCHNGDNSPDFDFNTYWPLVEHSEKDTDK